MGEEQEWRKKEDTGVWGLSSWKKGGPIHCDGDSSERSRLGWGAKSLTLEGGGLCTGWGRGSEGSWLRVHGWGEGSGMETDTWKMVFKATDLDEVRERRGASRAAGGKPGAEQRCGD